MAMAVVYTTFAGQIVSENRGGVTREYISDPLGSTIALASSTEITDTWDYWPYGEVMSRTGTNPTPFTFVGTLGYFKDLLDKLFYVRARHYQPNYSRWLTVDLLWPVESAYAYSLNRPLDRIDPSGRIGQGIIGSILGCAIGGLGGFIGGLLSGESPGQAACRALVLCVAGAIIAAILAEWPLWAKCIAGSLGGLVAGLASALCKPHPLCSPPPPWQCMLFSALLSLATGCLIGGLGSALNEFLLKIIVGVYGAAMGSICHDMLRGRPGKFEPTSR